MCRSASVALLISEDGLRGHAHADSHSACTDHMYRWASSRGHGYTSRAASLTAPSCMTASLLALQGLPLPARAWHANRFPHGLICVASQQQPILSGTAGTAEAIKAVDKAANSLAIRPAEQPDHPMQSQQHLQVKH